MGILRSIVNLLSPNEEKNFMELPGRNEPCWCGSGKKYKKCHLYEDEKKAPRNFKCGST